MKVKRYRYNKYIGKLHQWAVKPGKLPFCIKQAISDKAMEQKPGQAYQFLSLLQKMDLTDKTFFYVNTQRSC